MAHPVIWPKKSFFYPIGNTSPLCFTRDISPDEKAAILLLACGDPRSILYTIHADLADSYRNLDFTCCDWEPAVLGKPVPYSSFIEGNDSLPARNILLLTMIADDVPTVNMWSIFYNFYLDEVSYKKLLSHCRILIQSGSDMKTWKSSKYGTYIRFCTEDSLSQIRHHWSLYADTDNLGDKEKETLRKSFTSGMKSVIEKYSGHGINALRAAGPLAPSFINQKAAGQTHLKFWSTGITPSKPSLSVATPHINPTFAYSLSGETFNVHYGTDPILAFHTSPALTAIKGAQFHATTSAEDLFEVARSQFSAWCLSFKRRVHIGSTPNIIVRFYVGESLAFCRALHICKEARSTKTSVYTSSWTGLQIDFDVEDYTHSPSPLAPLLFNVIDTSNLSDHAGLFNLLVVSLPLIQRKVCSVLYTDTLHPPSSENSTIARLNEMTFANIPTLSILLGITPSPHLWHFTTHSNKHEFAAASLFSGQFYESISWRIPPSIFSQATVTATQSLEDSPIQLVCEPIQLANFFFSVYMRMFDQENQTKNMFNIERVCIQNVVHYLRATFVSFLALVKERVKVDWTLTMDRLIDLIATDRTFLMGLNNYQDLICQMYLRKIHTLDVLTSFYLETVRCSGDRFHGWRSIPPVVCVILKIPRKHLKVLEDIEADNIGTPMLQCQSSGISFHNMHSSIQLSFGDIDVSQTATEPHVSIKEDPQGWHGKSSLIATFYLPSWILTVEPKTTKIGLHIWNTPATVFLMRLLGMNLTIYSTSLMDTTHVQIVRHRPNNTREVDDLRNLPAFANSVSAVSNASPNQHIMVNFAVDSQKATTMVIRNQISTPKAAKSLSEGAAVVMKPISDSTVIAIFDGHTQPFRFPFPIHGEKSKTRIARKSSYIEIESPIRSNFEDTLDLSLNPFNIYRDGEAVSLLSIHYLKLDDLPALQLPRSAKQLDWLSIHLGYTLSDIEREIQGSTNDYIKHGALLNIKETLGHIFYKYSGFEGSEGHSDVFALSNPSDGTGIYALIFINAMKLDLGSQTVVLDACAVMLNQKIARKMPDLLERAQEHSVGIIVTLDDETKAWKQLFPAYSERCRTWKHFAKCDYRTKVLCSCGTGKNLGSFAAKSEWNPLHDEATRIAIGPLFAFSSKGGTTSTSTSTSTLPSVTSSSADPRCAKCGSSGKPTLSSCAVCKNTKYCSRECQKAHWKAHKPVCVRPQ